MGSSELIGTNTILIKIMINLFHIFFNHPNGPEKHTKWITTQPNTISTEIGGIYDRIFIDNELVEIYNTTRFDSTGYLM